MDINQVLLSHGVLGGGGGSGVKKIYQLAIQNTAPQNPKVGDMWIKSSDNITKVTVSLNVPTTPQEGEILLQFTHIIYELDFKDISAKVIGNDNQKKYVFNISELTNEIVSNNFIPLFQKDVVKELGILKKIALFKSGSWVIPESYYYNGINWVNMSYCIYTQLYDNKVIKTVPETGVVNEVVSLPSKAFQVSLDGKFYVKDLVNRKLNTYKKDGTLLSALQLPATTTEGYYFANIVCVDDFGNIYAAYHSTSGFTAGRYLVKFNAYGERIWLIDNGVQGTTVNTLTSLLGFNEKYLVMVRQGDGNHKCLIIINMNTGTYSLGADTYSRYTSKIQFDTDHFYVLVDSWTSTGGFSFQKISYDGSILAQVSVSSGSGYILGLYTYLNSKMTIKVDTVNKFLYVSFVDGNSNTGTNSINKIQFNFDTNTLTKVWQLALPKPTSPDYTTKSPDIVIDNDFNFYVASYDKLLKYNLNGIKSWEMLFPSSYYRSDGYFYSGLAFQIHDYNKG